MEITMVCIDPSRNVKKFWKASVEFNSYVATWGRIGQDPVEQAKTFRSGWAARQHLAKKVAEKRAKGYVEL